MNIAQINGYPKFWDGPVGPGCLLITNLCWWCTFAIYKASPHPYYCVFVAHRSRIYAILPQSREDKTNNSQERFFWNCNQTVQWRITSAQPRGRGQPRFTSRNSFTFLTSIVAVLLATTGYNMYCCCTGSVPTYPEVVKDSNSCNYNQWKWILTHMRQRSKHKCSTL